MKPVKLVNEKQHGKAAERRNFDRFCIDTEGMRSCQFMDDSGQTYFSVEQVPHHDKGFIHIDDSHTSYYVYSCQF